MTLSEFADWLDAHKPSAAQLAISPDYNHAVVNTLRWVAAEARKIEQGQMPPKTSWLMKAPRLSSAHQGKNRA